MNDHSIKNCLFNIMEKVDAKRDENAITLKLAKRHTSVCSLNLYQDAKNTYGQNISNIK